MSSTLEEKSFLQESLQWSSISRLIIPVAGVILGILLGSLVVVSPERGFFQIVGRLFHGAFGTLDNFAGSLIYAIPLGFTGLAIVFSYSAGVFNIGGEGQLQLAAVATTLVATVTGFSSPLLHTFLAIAAGALVGALWAFVPGLLRAYKGFNEIVVTMLLNYVAILLVSYFVQGPIKDPAGYFPQSRPIAATSKLHTILPGTHLHSGFIIFLGITVVVFIILHKTVFGFRVRSVGLNPEGAKYAGTNVKMTIVYAMLVSGALAGIGGSVEILGVHSRLLEGFSPGYGYDAIAVALLANLNPFGVILSSFFFGALRNAAANLQIDLGIPVSFVYIIQAIAILFVISSHGMPKLAKRIKKRFRHA